MKKHLLSMYQTFDKEINGNLGKGGTCETRSQENSDPDEFTLGPTILTETIENSDVDELSLQGPTYVTFTSEITDQDEFCVDILCMSTDEDFDEILLI